MMSKKSFTVSEVGCATYTHTYHVAAELSVQGQVNKSMGLRKFII
jgi:hypothetical protein